MSPPIVPSAGMASDAVLPDPSDRVAGYGDSRDGERGDGQQRAGTLFAVSPVKKHDPPNGQETCPPPGELDAARRRAPVGRSEPGCTS
jgi:hypothetical protein